MAQIAFQSRFDGWSARSAWAALLALFLGIVISTALPTSNIETRSAHQSARMTDPILYQNIAARVAEGENYYAAAANEHRAGHFPLRPFVTVRPPTLALINANLGPGLTRALLVTLIIAAILVWRRKLMHEHLPRPLFFGSLVAIAISTALIATPILAWFHESWAALLMAMSLALRRPNRVSLSILAGLAAVIIRETALPYLLLMLAIACWQRKWRETLGWSGAILIFAVLLSVHAAAVAVVVRPDDLQSQGWDGLGGWPLYVSAMSAATPLTLLPNCVAQVAIPLCLFGWAGWKSDTGLRAFGLIMGYATLVMVFARPDTFYWGLLMAPLLLAGGVLAIPSLITLVRIVTR